MIGASTPPCFSLMRVCTSNCQFPSLEAAEVIYAVLHDLFSKVESRNNNRLGLIKDYYDRYSVGDLICGIAIAVLPMTVIVTLALILS